jgi:hypothetical protein
MLKKYKGILVILIIYLIQIFLLVYFKINVEIQIPIDLINGILIIVTILMYIYGPNDYKSLLLIICTVWLPVITYWFGDKNSFHYLKEFHLFFGTSEEYNYVGFVLLSIPLVALSCALANYVYIYNKFNKKASVLKNIGLSFLVCFLSFLFTLILTIK